MYGNIININIKDLSNLIIYISIKNYPHFIHIKSLISIND